MKNLIGILLLSIGLISCNYQPVVTKEDIIQRSSIVKVCPTKDSFILKDIDGKLYFYRNGLLDIEFGKISTDVTKDNVC